MDMANILASVDAIKTARLNRTIGETALADREERKRIEAEERAKAIADEGALRGARTEAWNSGGQNVGGLVGLDPQGAAAILSHFQSLAAAGKTEQIQTAKDNAETMGRLFAWVKTSPDPASAYAQARQNLPAAMQKDVPEAYDPGYVDMALARTMSVADIMEQATAAKADKAFTDGMGALAQPQGAPAAAAPAGSPMPTLTPGAPPVGPQQPNSGPSQQAAYAHARLVKSGLSPAAASGVVGNLMQESGSNLNPSSWNPEEGALGIAQWREDRRVKLVNFAEAHGTDPRDFDTQLDFIMHELDTSEKAAGDRLRQATTPQEAAAIFDKLYERSSGQHIDKRAQNAAMLHSALGGKEYADAGAMPGPEAGPAAPQGGLDPRIVALMQAAGQQQDAGRRDILTKAIDILNEQSQQKGFRQATTEEAAAYGASAGQFGPDGRFYPINPPSGMTIESDGQGGFRMAQGEGVTGKPLNEGQSKNVIFATRAEGALPIVDQFGDALMSRTATMAEQAPLGIGREWMQSPEFQQARQAGLEFLAAILRKDTGAAVTPSEEEMYGRMYLPRPGDLPEMLAQKQASRARAVEAIRRGMTPSEILALEKQGASDPNAALARPEPPVDNGQGPVGGTVRSRAVNDQGQMIEYNGARWVPVQQ